MKYLLNAYNPNNKSFKPVVVEVGQEPPEPEEVDYRAYKFVDGNTTVIATINGAGGAESKISIRNGGTELVSERYVAAEYPDHAEHVEDFIKKIAAAAEKEGDLINHSTLEVGAKKAPARKPAAKKPPEEKPEEEADSDQ